MLCEAAPGEELEEALAAAAAELRQARGSVFEQLQPWDRNREAVNTRCFDRPRQCEAREPLLCSLMSGLFGHLRPHKAAASRGLVQADSGHPEERPGAPSSQAQRPSPRLKGDDEEFLDWPLDLTQSPDLSALPSSSGEAWNWAREEHTASTACDIWLVLSGFHIAFRKDFTSARASPTSSKVC